MSPSLSDQITFFLRTGALKISFVYLVAGLAWILFSDAIAYDLAGSGSAFLTISTYKGFGFIIVTTIVLYVIILLFTKDVEHQQRILSESEQRFRSVIQNSSDIIRILDEKGKIAFESPSSAKILGYPEGSLIGKDPLDFIHPEDQDLVKNDRDQIYSRSNPGTPTVFRIRKSDGSYLYVESVGVNLLDIPEVRGIVTTTHPIDKLKQAEDAAKRSNAYNRSLIEASLDPLVTIGPDGRITDVNKATEYATGFTRDHLIGTDFSDYFTEPEKAKAGYLQIFRDGVVHDYPLRLRNRNGRVIPVLYNASVYRDERGEVAGVFAAARDMTAQMKAEEEIHRTESKYRLLIESMRDAFASVDMTGLIRDFNPTFLDMLGYSGEELVKMTYRDITPEKWHVVEDRILNEEVIPLGYSGVYEKEYRRKDRTVFPVELRTYLIRDNNGVPEGMWAIIRDISERRLAEEALKKNRIQLTAAMDLARLVNWEFDLATGMFTFDDRFYALYGTSKEREGGLMMPADVYIREFVHPEDAERVVKKIGEAYTTHDPGFVDQIEHRIIRRDGKVRDIIARYGVVIGPGGGVISTYGSNQDITERHLAEQAIKESEKRYRSLFENMLEGFAYCRMIYDDNGHPVDFVYLNVNEAFHRIIGTTDVTGRRVTEVFPGIREAFPNLFDIYGRVAQTGNPEAFDLDFKPSAKWLHLSAYSPERGFFVAVFEDITLRKYDEDVLRLSNEILQVSYKHQILGTLLDEYIDLIGKYTGCNSIGIRLLDADGSIPYLAYSGFSREFYEQESPLSVENDECMCINVIKGATSPNLPFYTKAGSFFMNGTTKFLAGISEEEKGRTRNVCNQTGYESVALVPIREQEKIVGLIHIADRRDNMVPLGIVNVLETVAISIGEAIKRLRVEEALHESEEKFRGIFNSVNDAIQIHEINEDGLPGKFIEVNDIGCRMLQYTRQELLENSPIDFTSSYHSPSLEKIGEDLKTLGHAVFETEHIRKDGSLIPVEINAHVVTLQGKTVVISVVRDISDRKTAEQTIRESEQKFRRIFDSANDGIVIIDVTSSGMPGKIRDANSAYCTKLGYTKQELQGMILTDIVAPEMYPKMPSIMMELLSTKHATFESRHLRKDGTILEFELSAHIIKFRDQDIVIEIARDITQRKKEEQALRLANQKLQLMNIVAWHDIQNKVTGLRGYVDLSRDLIKDPQARVFLAREEEILRVIHDQIQYTKEYQEMGNRPPQWMDIPRIVDSLVSSMNRPEIQISSALRGLFLYCDPIIEKMFSNLIENTLNNGEKATMIRIWYEESPQGLTLLYEDDGVGIPANQKENVFARDVAKSSHFALYFIHDILELSGMQIKETGEPGKGVRFEISVPSGIYRITKSSGTVAP